MKGMVTECIFQDDMFCQNRIIGMKARMIIPEKK